ncbi:xylulokinase [Demequina zhanjiangensis]|uniref:FGGY-family carbohydrate kinase n=1 Tax=Demequina zhanjiangensis TaxID=3051659 RepID=A0ABT8G3Y3_9MICO|nr:FGGY-family carbohydrate kinase [Demequina sp. SYSU T00b26]MDN4473404.1 FGGY-family carbohydrate kinase [Demequina sp. SYSU T00b26]
MAQQGIDAAAAIAAGQTSLGIELGSTRIKACLIGPDHEVLATGSHAWENQFVDRLWTYSEEAIWEGLQASIADLKAEVQKAHGVALTSVGALGFSAMMHGYLAFDSEGSLLVPFRTWRNTNTEAAAAKLTEELGFNFPLRWSASHVYQAIIDEEPHVAELDFITTLAGYVHWKLTGRKVLGVGDASGMFPIDPATHDYDAAMLARFKELAAEGKPGLDVTALLPEVLVAGQDAGTLTEEGAALLDPTGELKAGAPVAPPEGDAGTGMVATNAVAPRTGNISAGTSIFAMVVLEEPLDSVHEELDIVTTPGGDLVAMVHCNNGASELGTWAGVFTEFATAMGVEGGADAVFETLFTAALEGEADGGGLLAYNYLSGEPITGMAEGRPLFVRTPGSRLTLANFMRTQLYGAFGTLSIGMKVLHDEGVKLDSMFAHGGMFRTAGVAQRLLAAAIDAPVSVGDTASEGGAWGIAVLAEYLRKGTDASLGDYLNDAVFADATLDTVSPTADDVAGYDAWLAQYRAGLAIERAATEAIS